MFVNVKTQIVFPRRVLCFEVSLSKCQDKTGLREMVESMIKDSTPEAAILLLSALLNLNGIDKSSWQAEAIFYDVLRQSFNYMVSSPDFPVHLEGCEVRRIGNTEQLLCALASESELVKASQQ
jgi:hypothetical protein